MAQAVPGRAIREDILSFENIQQVRAMSLLVELLREPKLHFYDVGLVAGDDGRRLENLVAVCLQKRLAFLFGRGRCGPESRSAVPAGLARGGSGRAEPARRVHRRVCGHAWHGARDEDGTESRAQAWVDDVRLLGIVRSLAQGTFVPGHEEHERDLFQVGQVFVELPTGTNRSPAGRRTRPGARRRCRPARPRLLGSACGRRPCRRACRDGRF